MILALLIGPAAPASAQPIHGHPQKAAYASEAERPPFEPQCHWHDEGGLPEALPDGSNSREIIEAVMRSDKTAHTHFRFNPPVYSELAGTLRLPFTIRAFQTAGLVSFDMGVQRSIAKIEWDDTGSEVAPIMRGDPLPHRLIEWSGHLTYDVNLDKHDGYVAPPKGWWFPQGRVDTRYDRGAIVSLLFHVPFYSMRDPSAPEVPEFPRLIAGCYPHSTLTNEWGNNYVEVDSFLPLAPIFAPWPVDLGTASYGGVKLGNGLFEHRVGVDLHAGILGTVLKSMPEVTFKSTNRAPVIDPAVQGVGRWRELFMWSKPSIHNEEIVSTLLPWDVTIGEGAPPPPPLCQDPKATNVGAPLPCLFDPPPVDLCPNLPGVQTTIPAGLVLVNGQCVAPTPPPPDWATIGTIPALPGTRPLLLQQFGTALQFRLCVSGTSPLQCLVWP